MGTSDKPCPLTRQQIADIFTTLRGVGRMANEHGVKVEQFYVGYQADIDALEQLVTSRSADLASKIAAEQSVSPAISVVSRGSPASTAPDEPAMAKPSTVAHPLGAGYGEGRSRDDSRERPATSSAPSSERATNLAGSTTIQPVSNVAGTTNNAREAYTPDQQRAADYIVEISGIGGGDDPVGFLIASHAALASRSATLPHEWQRLVESASEEGRLSGQLRFQAVGWYDKTHGAKWEPGKEPPHGALLFRLTEGRDA